MSAVFLSVLPLPPLAFLEGVSFMEMALVAVIGLLLFGGKGLPDMARTFGKVMREIKKATQGVEDEVRRAMNEEVEAPPRPRPKPASLPAPNAVSRLESAPLAPARSDHSEPHEAQASATASPPSAKAIPPTNLPPGSDKTSAA